MNFDILDFLWYLIKILAYSSLVLILASVIVALIGSIFNEFKKRKRQEILDELIKQAIENGEYGIEIIGDKKTKKEKK